MKLYAEDGAIEVLKALISTEQREMLDVGEAQGKGQLRQLPRPPSSLPKPLSMSTTRGIIRERLGCVPEAY